MMHGFGFIPVLLPFLFAGAVVYIVTRSARSRQPWIETGSHDTIEKEPSTERRIYQLARRNNGSITVSDVVADVGLSAAEAERQLQGMTDEMRVRMEVSDDGVVTYTFPEFTRKS